MGVDCFADLEHCYKQTGRTGLESMRKCLKCDKSFWSVGPHERLCYYCRENIKKSGISYPEDHTPRMRE